MNLLGASKGDVLKMVPLPVDWREAWGMAAKSTRKGKDACITCMYYSVPIEQLSTNQIMIHLGGSFRLMQTYLHAK